MQEQDNGPQGLLDEIDAYLLGERLFDAWEELAGLDQELCDMLGETSEQLEGGIQVDGVRIDRPDLPHTRAEYEQLSERLSAARPGFDAEVMETVRLLDERAAWRIRQPGVP